VSSRKKQRLTPLIAGVALLGLAVVMIGALWILLPLVTQHNISTPRALFTILSLLIGAAGVLLIAFRRAQAAVRVVRAFTRLPLWLIPLTLSLVLLPLCWVHTSPDSAWYMANGLNLSLGRGYVDSGGAPVLLRGPGLPALLAAGYRVFGPSVETSHVVCRLFFVLGVMCTYALSAMLLDRRSGLCASLLVLTSGTLLNIFNDVLPDHIVASLMLLSLVLLFRAFRSRKLILFTVAGLTLGCAYLVKEIALVFVAVPWLALLFARLPEKRRLIMGSALFALGFLVVSGPWIGYLATQNALPMALGTTGALLMTSSTNALGSVSASIARLAALFASGAFAFIAQMTTQLTVSALLWLSWAVALVRVVLHRSVGSSLMVAAALTVVPVAILQGGLGYRTGQAAVFYMLGFVALGTLVVRASDLVAEGLSTRQSKKGLEPQVLRGGLLALVMTVLLCSQIVTEGSVHRILRSVPFYFWGRITASGWHGEEARDVAEWIRENATNGETILVDWYLQDSLYFLTAGESPFVRIPYVVSPQSRAPVRQAGVAVEGQELAAFIDVEKKSALSAAPITESYLRAVRSSDIVASIQEHNAEFVVITCRRDYLTEWFNEQEAFERVRKVGATTIYAVVSDETSTLKPVITPVRVSRELGEYLTAVREARPTEYQQLVEVYFPSLGVSEDQIELLQEGVMPEGVLLMRPTDS